jgi:hypothetical protein
MAITPFGSSVFSSIVAQFARETDTARRILVVDPVFDIPPALRGLIGAHVIVTKSAQLTQDLLFDAAPDVVLVPLMGVGPDVYDVTLRLLSLGYKGRVRAFCRPLPNAALICNEVRARFPSLDFGLIELPDRGSYR